MGSTTQSRRLNDTCSGNTPENAPSLTGRKTYVPKACQRHFRENPKDFASNEYTWTCRCEKIGICRSAVPRGCHFPPTIRNSENHFPWTENDFRSNQNELCSNDCDERSKETDFGANDARDRSTENEERSNDGELCSNRKRFRSNENQLGSNEVEDGWNENDNRWNKPRDRSNLKEESSVALSHPGNKSRDQPDQTSEREQGGCPHNPCALISRNYGSILHLESTLSPQARNNLAQAKHFPSSSKPEYSQD